MRDFRIVSSLFTIFWTGEARVCAPYFALKEPSP